MHNAATRAEAMALISTAAAAADAGGPSWRGSPGPTGPACVMGVVNVTPDSFSDGGRWATPDAAIAHGRELLADGADLLDVGGESTRPGRHPAAGRPRSSPGSSRSSRALAGDGATVSVDTMRSRGGRGRRRGRRRASSTTSPAASPTRGCYEVVAASGAAYVAMHWRAHSDTMQQHASYDGPGGVVAAVRDELAERVEAMLAAGIAPDRIVLDPGIGFAKTAEHNWALLRGLGPIADLGFPVLVGASRKSFLGSLLAGPDGVARGVEDREHASSALHVLLAQEGVWGLRTHDVRAAHDALRALARWNRTPSPHRGHLHDRRAPGPAHRHRDRVLRLPRRLRAREARGTAVRGGSHPGPRHPRGGRQSTTCATPSTTGVSWPR